MTCERPCKPRPGRCSCLRWRSEGEGGVSDVAVAADRNPATTSADASCREPADWLPVQSRAHPRRLNPPVGACALAHDLEQQEEALKNRLLRLAVALACAAMLGPAAILAAPGAASAASCGGTHYGGWEPTQASFNQQVTLQFCSDGSVKVGVWVQPYSSYEGSHVVGCTAHLVLIDVTLGFSTRSDRPQGCDMSKARASVKFSVGPSAWASQTTSDTFLAAAWVNIKTSAGTEYDTSPYFSQVCVPDIC